MDKLKGYLGAYVAYPIAEKVEKRQITSKIKELDRYYKIKFEQRKVYMKDKLIETLQFVNVSIPYYQDLFKKINFDIDSIQRDMKYLNDIPFLTKDIIREEGERLLSAPLSKIKHHVRKTGGSTGKSATIYYDQIGLDYSAAVTKYCRDTIGASPHKSELHFAASFAEPSKKTLPTKEDVKNFAMNRSNVFFDRLDDIGLEKIWNTINERKPYLVHGHPSTIYALAYYLDNKVDATGVFDVFESSGEMIQSYMIEKIKKVFGCRIINRYGLAEFGVIGYELNGDGSGLKLLESEGFPENKNTEDGDELVFTGFHNRLMPLIRYSTGDMGKVVEKSDGYYLENVTGRIHDMVTINGILYPTHNIMDVLDHIVGGVQEFQVDVRGEKPILKICPEDNVDQAEMINKIKAKWQDGMEIEFVSIGDFVKVGERAKFRHVVK